MCISATLNGSTIQYVLSSTGKFSLGWMGMGFGRQMANTPMVIMWPNADGTITLSQRSAPQQIMPTVVSSPPRVASISQNLSTVSGSTPQLAYTIPTDGNSKPFVIYAFSTTPPSSAAVDATLVEHIDFGTLQLDLTKSLSTDGSSTSTNGPSQSSSNSIPLLPYQRMIVAHAVFCLVGFLLLLPVGGIIARYLRTFTSGWFRTHWIVQFVLAGPAIVIGVALGIRAIDMSGALHLDDDHKRWGIAIFVLYGIQCGLGAFIHFVKPKQKGRPPQNYFHAIFGLLIVGLAFFQVRTGYHEEWVKATGRPALPNAVNIVFFLWLALLAAVYFFGLSLLPRQYRQESSHNKLRAEPDDDEDNTFNMAHIDERERYSDHPIGNR
ncbi:hypothetical protein BDQ17DRAFT_1286196 [Cyathus striatus]|nr:hypothetical protein BDQ17DRAFT_1286196 [Cyathus striatus]